MAALQVEKAVLQGSTTGSQGVTLYAGPRRGEAAGAIQANEPACFMPAASPLPGDLRLPVQVQRTVRAESPSCSAQSP